MGAPDELLMIISMAITLYSVYTHYTQYVQFVKGPGEIFRRQKNPPGKSPGDFSYS